MTVASELGRFIVQTEHLPSRLVHEGKRSILNFVGAGLAVANDPAVESAINVMVQSGASGVGSVIGQAQRLEAGAAAFVNAVAGNLLDFDDTHLDTVIHPSAPTFPPALALAEREGRSGSDLLVAFVIGAEVACRLGNSVSPSHYARGWHITSTCGVFGAAATAAKLLRLDAEQSTHALGIAASLSSGIVENLPSGAKNVGVGNSARNGILAALFAQQGYGSAPEAVEGQLGWAEASGERMVVETVLNGVGDAWEFAKNTYKPYPSGIVMHSVIDACLELGGQLHGQAQPGEAGRGGYALDVIESVTVTGDALLMARGDRVVRDARDARVSIHHAAAAPLLWGRAGIDEFVESTVFAPEAVAMRARVHAELDPALPPAAARVRISTRDGRQLETTVLEPVGSLSRPMSDDDLEGKLGALVQTGGANCDPRGIATSIWSLDESRTVDTLAFALRAP